jgi:hypothetical protein
VFIKRLDEAGGVGLDMSPGDDLAWAAAREIRSLVSVARYGWLEVKDLIRRERAAHRDATLYEALETQADNVLAELETDL